MDVGQGEPIVVIPGIQGRWEWLSPAIQALAARYRVLSFSLTARADDASQFDAWLQEMDAVLDRAGISTATFVGVSFGGLIGVRYAAMRPSRVRALVLVSTPAPRMRLDPRSRVYVRHPRLALPAFAWRGFRRLLPETLAARPGWGARLSFLAAYTGRVVRFPISPSQMAHWVRAWEAADIAADCRRVAARTLVITGEPELDRVVPVTDTLEYVTLIPGARAARFPRTGHVGFVSRPADFARIVSEFVDDDRRRAEARPA